MGLGVAVPVGGMSIALDYEGSTYTAVDGAYAPGGVAAYALDASEAVSGFEISVTMPVGDASAGVNISSTSSVTTVNGTAGDAAVTGGTELWYTVPIGPVSLSAGYGSAAVTDGATTAEMGVEMSMSF
jgi:hypothetical protein